MDIIHSLIHTYIHIHHVRINILIIMEVPRSRHVKKYVRFEEKKGGMNGCRERVLEARSEAFGLSVRRH